MNAGSTLPHTTGSGTFLGFDFGLRRIGVAVGQRVSGTATALTVLPARDGKPDWTEVESLVREWSPEGMVIGVPLSMSGEEQEITRAARRFGTQLRTRFDIPLYEVDERLSSRQAEEEFARQRRQGNARRKDRGRLDATAARIILEDWLGQGEQAS